LVMLMANARITNGTAGTSARSGIRPAESRTAATSTRPCITTLLLASRLPGGVRVAAERVRDVPDRALRPDAVARVVERRRHDGDAELARRDGNDTAADAPLRRQAPVLPPLAGVVVETRRRHHP